MQAQGLALAHPWQTLEQKGSIRIVRHWTKLVICILPCDSVIRCGMSWRAHGQGSPLQLRQSPKGLTDSPPSRGGKAFLDGRLGTMSVCPSCREWRNVLFVEQKHLAQWKDVGLGREERSGGYAAVRE